KDRNMSEGNPHIVSELVHEYPVALDDRRLHGSARHLVPVGERAAKHDHQANEQRKPLVFPPRSREPVFHEQVSFRTKGVIIPCVRYNREVPRSPCPPSTSSPKSTRSS